MKNNNRFLFFSLLLFTIGCGQNTNKTNQEKPAMMKASLNKKPFGEVEGRPVMEYTLSNIHGMEVSIINYGGIITRIITPDKNGKPGDVVLGYDSLAGYLQKGNPYFGALVGRYANRIAAARFTLDGKEYSLAGNDHGNSLHGGTKGYDKGWWFIEEQPGDSSLRLSYYSKDGEEGYPGNLKIAVVYTLGSDNSLKIDYMATTDKATPVNLTNHSYFNLSAGRDSTILNHSLTILANQYTPVNAALIPTGQLAPVKGSPMDFTSPKIIGRDIAQVEGGYDHNWVLSHPEKQLSLSAELCDSISGRCMEVWTTEPGLQFYSGNFLNGSLQGTKGGQHYIKHTALSLEAQHFPDAPNQPGFPNTILHPGETYTQSTIYRFKIK